jgi:DNA-binding transcriptional LysR family regulator
MFDELFSRSGISLERLRALVEIYDAGSIAGAAPGDPVRNSQHSRQLRELAEFFGCELAERKGKNITLTEDGVQLAKSAGQFLQHMQDLAAHCRNDRIAYNIGAGDSLIQWLVIPRVAAIVDALPEIRLGTTSMRTADIVKQVDECRLDLGLVRRTAETRGLRSVNLGRMGYCLMVPNALIAGKVRPMIPDVFRDYPMAMQISAGEFTTRLREIAVQSGPNFRPALACQSLPQVLAAVRSRRFAAVLPELALADLPQNTFTKLAGSELNALRRDICLIWNPRLATIRPHALRLIEQCQITFQLGGRSHR